MAELKENLLDWLRDAHAMEQLEREILAGLGFDDPYR